MQNFGMTNKEYYGMLWYFLEWPIECRLALFCEILAKFFFMESKIQQIFAVESRILGFRIRNPTTDWYPESSSWNPEFPYMGRLISLSIPFQCSSGPEEG